MMFSGKSSSGSSAVIFLMSILLITGVQLNAQTGKIKNKKAFFEKLARKKQKTIVQKELNIGGKAIPSEGTVKALFIFIQFDDDSTTKSKNWPYDTINLPDWTKQFVENKPTAKFKVNNLTQYFYEMSNGKLFLTGDVYPELVRPVRSMHSYKNISEVNTEILTRLDDKIDFSKYDNWSKDENGKFVMKPDGKVDMIFLIYRNFPNKLFFNQGWTGIAHLYLSRRYLQTNDGVIIKSGSLDKGSGIIIRGGKNGFYWLKYIAAHEFGHFLLGAGHIEGTTNLALMTGGPVWNASRGMHSWERARLGWMKYTDVKPGIDAGYILPDYMTTGSALRLKLSEKEWFVIENRQKISRHDKAGDKGIYIYHILNPYHFAPSVFVECADGNWNFKIDTTNKKLIKSSPNPFGKNEMNFSKYVKGKNYACFKPVYETNAAWGDDKDAFDLTFNNVFSPVSNPSSFNKAKISFTIEVTGKTGNDYVLKFYFKNPYAGKPAKPQFFRSKKLHDNKLLLTWVPNKEPDMLAYRIYRTYGKTFNNKNLNKLVEIPFLFNREPLSEFIIKHEAPGKADVNTYYVLTAVDKNGNESVLSDYVEVK